MNKKLGKNKEQERKCKIYKDLEENEKDVK